MEKNKLGMALFIGSESVFFLLLILAYVNYHRQTGNGPSAASSLNVFKTSIYSLFLFASSATVWRAGTSLKRGRRRAVPIWLAATIVLGAAFLLGQASEYLDLIHRKVTISRDLFGTTFFTLTGFHGLHVLIGLVMLLTLFGLSLWGTNREPRSQAMESVSMYWHFVDVVWVAIFSIVYLWGVL